MPNNKHYDPATLIIRTPIDTVRIRLNHSSTRSEHLRLYLLHMIFGLSIKLLAGLTILLAAGFIPALTVSAVLVLLGASFNLGWGYAIIYLVILLSNVTDIARMMEERKHREYIAAGKP